MLTVQLGQPGLFGRGETDDDGDLVRDDGAHAMGETLHDRAQGVLAREPRDRDQRMQLAQGVLGQEGLDQVPDLGGDVGQRAGALLKRLDAPREVHPAALLAPLHEHLEPPAARVGCVARPAVPGGLLDRVRDSPRLLRGRQMHTVCLRQKRPELFVGQPCQFTVEDLDLEARLGQRTRQPPCEVRLLGVEEHGRIMAAATDNAPGALVSGG
ncbi:hypothetical protein [Streptomyces sp. SAI-127]|uniref:hypothetical protein n=1 Tax=Streptomyces sp. SAI-127 TaxID=2940543 RepID=UPI0024756314|nr:hypothetical protein [Streptomyces sp. SAI-127]